jgi:transcriptional antiterminator NusG
MATVKNQKKITKKPKKKVRKKAGPRQPEPGHIIIKKSDDKRASWYVVHTYSGHEAKVAEQLRQRVISMGLEDKVSEVLIPTQDKIQIRSGKKETVKEKIFPGYLLIRMVLTDQSWLTVRTTPGITGFVGLGTKPTPLETEEVKAIQKFSEIKAPKFKAKFSLGEAVKIIDGPFADFLGTIDKIDEDKGRLRVLVSIFGRETPVELDFLQVSKI